MLLAAWLYSMMIVVRFFLFLNSGDDALQFCVKSECGDHPTDNENCKDCLTKYMSKYRADHSSLSGGGL